MLSLITSVGSQLTLACFALITIFIHGNTVHRTYNIAIRVVHTSIILLIIHFQCKMRRLTEELKKISSALKSNGGCFEEKMCFGKEDGDEAAEGRLKRCGRNHCAEEGDASLSQRRGNRNCRRREFSYDALSFSMGKKERKIQPIQLGIFSF